MICKNKMEFLSAWRQLLDVYGCEDNLKYEEMPEGYDVEAWRRGHSTAKVLLETHLIESVFLNITRSSEDSPFAKWTVLENMFLNKHDSEVLTKAQTALLQCKQGPKESVLEHSGKFNKAVTRLVDLKDDHVKDENYVCCLFKQ